jgi:hypothetical protein
MGEGPVSEQAGESAPGPVPAGAEAPIGAPPQQQLSWLRENRLKIALGIALAEGIFVALENDFSRVTVIVIAIPVVLFYLLAGRTLDSPIGREIAWIVAMSQALAVVAAIVAITIPVVALVLAGVFGVIAVYLLFHDRPDQQGQATK